MSVEKKARLPRNKPIDYSIMRHAPFYDGMLTDAEREKVRNNKDLYECVKTAHYARGLYVGSVGALGNHVCMVTTEGFPVMVIGNPNYFELRYGYWPDDVYPSGKISTRPKKLSQAVSVIAHGVRRRSDYDDPWHFSGSRSAMVFGDMQRSLRRRYAISPEFVNLDSTATTWAALCAAGATSQIDIPQSVMSEITRRVDKYKEHVAEVDSVLAQLREGLCRKKWVVGCGYEGSIIVGQADMTPLFNSIRESSLRDLHSDLVDVKFDIPLRLYRSFDALPEEYKSSIAPRMIALNVREGRPQSEWATSLFPPVKDDCDYKDEIETLTMGSKPRINWYVINAQ